MATLSHIQRETFHLKFITDFSVIDVFDAPCAVRALAPQGGTLSA